MTGIDRDWFVSTTVARRKDAINVLSRYRTEGNTKAVRECEKIVRNYDELLARFGVDNA